MSIGLVIANIAGSFHPSPVATGSGVPSDALAAPAIAVAGSGDSARQDEPASGAAQLTPGFSVVVLELLNDKGAVVSTVPSARQLAAYRDGSAIPPS